MTKIFVLKLSSYHSKASDWCRALSAASLFYNKRRIPHSERLREFTNITILNDNNELN